jgi:hypothetical protein
MGLSKKSNFLLDRAPQKSVNASSATLQSPSHDSDSRWLAIPFLTTLSFVTPCRFIPALTSLVGCSTAR